MVDIITDAQKIANNIEKNDPASIKRAQLEYLDLCLEYQNNPQLLQQLHKQIADDLALDKGNAASKYLADFQIIDVNNNLESVKYYNPPGTRAENFTINLPTAKLEIDKPANYADYTISPTGLIVEVPPIGGPVTEQLLQLVKLEAQKIALAMRDPKTSGDAAKEFVADVQTYQQLPEPQRAEVLLYLKSLVKANAESLQVTHGMMDAFGVLDIVTNYGAVDQVALAKVTGSPDFSIVGADIVNKINSGVAGDMGLAAKEYANAVKDLANVNTPEAAAALVYLRNLVQQNLAGKDASQFRTSDGDTNALDIVNADGTVNIFRLAKVISPSSFDDILRQTVNVAALINDPVRMQVAFLAEIDKLSTGDPQDQKNALLAFKLLLSLDLANAPETSVENFGMLNLIGSDGSVNKIELARAQNPANFEQMQQQVSEILSAVGDPAKAGQLFQREILLLQQLPDSQDALKAFKTLMVAELAQAGINPSDLKSSQGTPLLDVLKDDGSVDASALAKVGVTVDQFNDLNNVVSQIKGDSDPRHAIALYLAEIDKLQKADNSQATLASFKLLLSQAGLDSNFKIQLPAPLQSGSVAESATELPLLNVIRSDGTVDEMLFAKAICPPDKLAFVTFIAANLAAELKDPKTRDDAYRRYLEVIGGFVRERLPMAASAFNMMLETDLSEAGIQKGTIAGLEIAKDGSVDWNQFIVALHPDLAPQIAGDMVKEAKVIADMVNAAKGNPYGKEMQQAELEFQKEIGALAKLEPPKNQEALSAFKMLLKYGMLDLSAATQFTALERVQDDGSNFSEIADMYSKPYYSAAQIEAQLKAGGKWEDAQIELDYNSTVMSQIEFTKLVDSIKADYEKNKDSYNSDIYEFDVSKGSDDPTRVDEVTFWYHALWRPWNLYKRGDESRSSNPAGTPTDQSGKVIAPAANGPV